VCVCVFTRISTTVTGGYVYGNYRARTTAVTLRRPVASAVSNARASRTTGRAGTTVAAVPEWRTCGGNDTAAATAAAVRPPLILTALVRGNAIYVPIVGQKRCCKNVEFGMKIVSRAALL